MRPDILMEKMIKLMRIKHGGMVSTSISETEIGCGIIQAWIMNGSEGIRFIGDMGGVPDLWKYSLPFYPGCFVRIASVVRHSAIPVPMNQRSVAPGNPIYTGSIFNDPFSFLL
jgi:hypothetical protein